MNFSVLRFDTIDSTNTEAARQARLGADEGLCIVSKQQTSGRGRQGRKWTSPKDAGIYLSIVLRPKIETASLPLITLASAIAVHDVIKSLGLQPDIKWPNDVHDGSRKLAGILAEAGSSAGVVDHVVLGFGINICVAAYPADVGARATSIESELGRDVDRGLVLAECLAALSNRYGMLQSGAADGVIAAWRRRAAPHMDRPVEWDVDGGSRQGRAEDIDATGALLVRVDDQIVRVISGEVRWL